MTNDPRLIDRLTEAAPASPEPAQDLVPLAWVLDEVRKTVLSAAKSLDRVAGGGTSIALNTVGEGAIRLAQEQFHRVAGVLELVQQPVAARFARALEDVAQRWADRAAGCTESEAGTVRQAGFALIEFLEDQLGERPRPSAGLFTPYRQVQELAKAHRIHPADMWSRPWRWRDLELAESAAPEPYGRALRERFDRGTLQLMRGGDAAAAADLSSGSLALAAAAPQGHARTFWTLAAAFYEALAQGALTVDRYVKGAASQTLLQFSELARAGSEPSERLAHDLLFFCALAQSPEPGAAPALEAVRAAWNLGRESLDAYQQPTFGLYDPEALAQAQRRIGAVKGAWSALAGGDAGHLDDALGQLSAVIDSMRALLPPGEPLTAELDAVRQKIAASRQPPSPQLGMETAAALLFLEASTAEFRPQDARFAERLKRLAERLASVRQGDRAPRFEPWMEQLYRQLNDKAAIGTVVDELRVGLAQTEQHLDRFFRHPQDAAPLEPVPGWLSEMHGVLSVLGMDQAAQAVSRIRARVGELRDAEDRPHGAALTALFQNFGNNFGTLGFLIDTLNYQPVLARKLFAYDEERGELMYVPGRVAAGTGIAKPAAPDIPDLPAMEPAGALSASARQGEEASGIAIAMPDAAAPGPALPSVLTQPPAAAVPLPAEDDALSSSDDDGGLLEIFLGEAQDVMASGHQALEALAQDSANHEHLTSLRRGFHTLKGSAAMLGLTEFSTAARALENVLNSWLAEEKPADGRLRAGSAAALDAFGRWVDALRAGHDGAWRAAPFEALARAMAHDDQPLDVDLGPASTTPAPLDMDVAASTERQPFQVPRDAAEGAAPTPQAPVPLDLPILPNLDLTPGPETEFTPPVAVPLPVASTGDLAAQPLPGAEGVSDAPPEPELPEPHLPQWDASADLPDLSLASPEEHRTAEHPEQPDAAPSHADVEGPHDVEATTQEPAGDEAEPDGAAHDTQLLHIGALEISEPLYSSFLKEADAWSEQLETRLSGWAQNLHAEVPEGAAYCAHSLAGSSATVGLSDLSALARAVEAALDGVNDRSRDLARGAGVLSVAATEIRAVLHQFAAGILRRPDAAVLSSVQALLPRATAQAGAAADWRTAARPAAMDAFDFDDAGDGASARTAEPMPESKGQPASWFASPKGSGDSLDHDLFPIFEEEAGELLPQLHAALQHWVEQPVDAGARAQVRRVLHTLKGSARLVGALTLGDMAHEAESAIEAMEGEHLEAADIQPLAERFDLIDETFQRLRDGADARSAAAPAPAAATAEWAPSSDDGAAPKPVAGPTPLVLPAAASAVQPTVRVHPELLDRLLASSSEVTTSRARLNSGVAQMRDALNELAGSVARLRRHVRDVELQVEAEMPAHLELLGSSKKDFDALEFDRYTKAQELTRMMAESVDDVETVERGLRRLIESGEDELAVQARQSRELQHDLVRTRMVDFDSVAPRLQRVVRQTADESGKQARLEITGGAIELDRAVLDRMVPAFEHLLRNSVVHGIEKPEVRAGHGKEPEGRISVEVRQTGNEVAITFDDDGAGLALDRIRARAIELGLVAPEEEPDAATLGRFIFKSGFTTAEQVTELAGRGVGMDVVQADVEALGGRIDVESHAGRGAVFHLTLPVTTALTRVVMMRAGELTFGVPSGLVETVRRPSAAELDQAYARASFAVGAEMLPFFWAGALLQSGGPSRAGAQSMSNAVVIFRSAARRIAVQVDDMLGNQEVMVKSLGPQLSRLPGLVAATVLSNGAVALIYNPVALVPVYGALHQDLLADPAAAQAASAAGVDGAVPVGPPLILVVDDSITVRRVMQRLLRRHGYRVALAADGQQGLDQIAQERPALVLTDIEMPRMDGFELLRAIRADGALADLPVVVITSRAAEKHRDHASELGATHYLGKPYSESELLALVQRYAAAKTAAAAAS